MVFSSYEFIFLFLPVVAVVYYLLSRLKNPFFQRLFLIAASLFFYGYYNVKYLFLIGASIAFNYIFAIIIQKHIRPSKAVFVLGIIFNVALIGYFKYYNFFVENVNAVFKTDIVTKNIALPLGISFFTFQQLSFLVSVYKKEERVENFFDYCLFVTFFPQLVAGPIVLYSEMIPQFKEEKRRYFNSENFATGLYMFAFGLFKKAFIADSVAVFADNGYGIGNIGFAAAWLTSLSYTMQIFFDFSGYSDMAIGLGKMFNIDLPFNFLAPYRSESISEFWRRWHITLGRALSTYIYIPLGGNRKGRLRTYINLMLTFLVSGLWHGAAWTFVVWGALNGAFCILERIFKKPLSKIPKPLRIFFTFIIVNFLWVLFRAESFSSAMAVYRGMLSPSNLALSQAADVVYDGTIRLPLSLDIALIAAALAVLLIVVFTFKDTRARLNGFKIKASTQVLSTVLFALSVLTLSKGSIFIYFNF